MTAGQSHEVDVLVVQGQAKTNPANSLISNSGLCSYATSTFDVHEMAWRQVLQLRPRKCASRIRSTVKRQQEDSCSTDGLPAIVDQSATQQVAASKSENVLRGVIKPRFAERKGGETGSPSRGPCHKEPARHSRHTQLEPTIRPDADLSSSETYLLETERLQLPQFGH